MRTFTLILSIGMMAMLLGCGLFDDGQETAESEGGASSQETMVESSVAPSVGSTIAYLGPTSLEERIFASSVIARVRLDSVSSAAESGTTRLGMKYIATLEFSFSVQEYLKGSGADDVVAVWNAGQIFDTRQEAENALPAIAAARDAQWDNREAVVFLKNSQTYLPSTQQVERFYLSGEHEVGSVLDDYYSLASRGNRLWLPAAAAVGAPSQPTGDQQRFLTDVPPATGTAPTITLGEIKTRIAAVTAKLDAGDGSEEYMGCVRLAYQYEGDDRYSIETGGDGHFSRTPDHDLDSGLAASSVVYEESPVFGLVPDKKGRTWLDGGDADLFSVEFGDAVPYDWSGDGVNDTIYFARRVVVSRPLPAGAYRFHFNDIWAIFVPCDGHTIRYEWTVTVNALDGTLHEAFFDPVADGTAVAADDTNGVLKPASFTGANGASAAIERIAWEAGTGESGTVTLKVTPHGGIADHIVEFIALDGSVALSLNVSDATVDAANHTLSWTAASQPWQSGDQLMLRIREVPDCSAGTAVSNPGANPGLVSDCEALLDLRYTLRGTASLNWSVDTAIAGWDGVTTGGTPSRITKLLLPAKSLTGSIPAGLWTLSALTHLDLSSNSLTGDIPAELGLLHNLQSLKLSGNSLTGCIPLALKDVAVNDLSSLNLLYCRPPAPGGLSAGTVGETSVGLSWGAVADAGTYRVEYRPEGPGSWTVDDDTLTGTSHTVDGLNCESAYQFLVGAYGSGTTYAAAWSDPSAPFTTSTGACVPPVFVQTSYTFSVMEDAAVDAAVGTVSATDNSGEPVTYAIVGGNADEKFAIDEDSGAITVVGSLSGDAGTTVTLTVEARDEVGEAATVPVAITVTDVAEDAPPAPGNLEATLANGTFSLRWDAVTGAARYEAQYTTDAADVATVTWTALAAVTTTTQTYAPADGPACSTTYRFRVRAYGDGRTYAAVWGPESEEDTVTTASCPPEFAQDYTFAVAEDAVAGHPVGTVSATDPDRDALTYSITAGNTGTAFAIGPGSGAITVAAALDHETTPSYTLTVKADDLKGGTDTATVTVTVSDVAEDAPPAPGNLAATLANGTFSLSWDVVTGVVRYEAQWRTDDAGSQWTALPEVTTTAQTYSPAGGPACGTDYRFRVRAYGDGRAYAAVWGTESTTDTVTTATCPPEFTQDYTFPVAEDAEAGDAVGTVTAMDPDGDTLTYTIMAGNTGTAFAIGPGSGAITVAGPLDHETTPSYTLTVKADDLKGGTDTATVTVTVTDVAEDAPPAPGNLGATLTNGTFSLSWDAVTGAAKYEAQYTTDAADAATVTWTALAESTAASAAYTPAEGPACSTTYRFRVRAYGDGETYAAVWGPESDTDTVTTASCPPEFAQDDYDFFIQDTAAIDSAVGRVRATDPDPNDTVTYAITAGNGDGKFAIDDGTGRLTVQGAFDLAATPAYTLTVEARDGRGGTDTARVTVALTLAACANGTVVPQPTQNQLLVRDCSALLTAKDTLRGTATLNWSADLAITEWDGVRRRGTNTQYVGTLYLPDLGLDGSIPAVLSGLADLRRLDLDGNALTGSIPAALGTLEDLEQLYLFNNQLTGSIPTEFGNLRSLQILSLSDNDLTGAIPPELGKLTRLRELLLDGNALTGELPTELGNLSYLENLYARDNQLTGAIPVELASLPNLAYLFLEGNSFTGCIPAGLRDVANHDLDDLGLTDCARPDSS